MFLPITSDLTDRGWPPKIRLATQYLPSRIGWLAAQDEAGRIKMISRPKSGWPLRLWLSAWSSADQMARIWATLLAACGPFLGFIASSTLSFAWS